LRCLRQAFRRGEGGQAMVEMCLVLPLFLLLVLGMAEVGRALATFLTLEHAAREGARVAIVGASDAEIEERVREAASWLDQGRLQVVVDPPEGERLSGQMVTVTVRYSYQFLAPFLDYVAGQFLPLKSSLSMRVE